MRLNPDLIRNILLVVEEKTDFNNSLDAYETYKNELLSDFSSDEIDYHVRQADLSGLLFKVQYFK